MLPNKLQMNRVREFLEPFTLPEERQNLLGLLPMLEGLAGQLTADDKPENRAIVLRNLLSDHPGHLPRPG